MFLMAWLILANSLLAPPAAADTPERQLRATVDARVELMSIIFRLAGNPEYNMANSKSAYADEVEQQFGPLRNHPAVKYAQELRSKSGISYDAVMSLAVHVSDALELNEKIPFDEAPARLDGRWKVEEAREFLKRARAFVQDSGFRRFLRKHEDFYKAAAERMTAKLAEHDYLAWLDSFFGQQPQATYSVIVGLLIGGGNYGVGVRYADGRQEIAPILGVSQFDEQGLPVFGDGFGLLLVHEFCHSYTNPLVDKYEPLLEPAGVTLYGQVSQQMQQQAYGNWKTMMYESLVRACVIRYVLATEGREAAVALAKEDYKRGFLWIGDLAKLLAEYDDNRTEHPKFDDFMPDVLVFFDQYAKKYQPAVALKTEKPEPATPSVADKAEPKKPADEAKPGAGKPAAKPPAGGPKGQAKRKVSGGGGGPRVILVEPGDGLKNIAPNTEFMTVLFDRPMMEAYSVCGPNAPEIAGDVQWDRPHTSVKIPVKLKPSTTYEFYLNCASDHKFKSMDGIELESYKVTFTTSG